MFEVNFTGAVELNVSVLRSLERKYLSICFPPISQLLPISDFTTFLCYHKCIFHLSVLTFTAIVYHGVA